MYFDIHSSICIVIENSVLAAAAAAGAKLAGAAIELVSEISQIRENGLIESKECHRVSQAGWRVVVLPVLHSPPFDIVCRCAN